MNFVLLYGTEKIEKLTDKLEKKSRTKNLISKKLERREKFSYNCCKGRFAILKVLLFYKTENKTRI